jgi:hypothetical protein
LTEGAERVAVPELDGIDRLDIIVAVEQHVRRACRSSWCATTIGWPGVAQACVKADQRQFRYQPSAALRQSAA